MSVSFYESSNCHAQIGCTKERPRSATRFPRAYFLESDFGFDNKRTSKGETPQPLTQPVILMYIHCMNRRPEIVKTSAAKNTPIPRLGVDFSALVVYDARVYKAGNSLAIRIPSTIAKRIALEDGVAVEMAADEGMLYIRKAPSRVLTDLIERITPENTHGALFDESVGAERWWKNTSRKSDISSG
jgi:antitoxin MazE